MENTMGEYTRYTYIYIYTFHTFNILFGYIKVFFCWFVLIFDKMGFKSTASNSSIS